MKKLHEEMPASASNIRGDVLDRLSKAMFDLDNNVNDILMLRALNSEY